MEQARSVSLTNSAHDGEAAEPIDAEAFLQARSLNLSPRHCGTSALGLHAPLLLWLTEQLEPELQVTLGPPGSVSHLSVCQAVQQLGLDSRCRALTGTAHALPAEVRDQHDRLYGGFSKLLPANWDEDGLQHFRCASIDWLHVDGEQELEHLRASWRSWRRRLSARAILSIHGLHPASSGPAGSWINRLQNCHPWLDFPHGEGLLVLAVGERQTRPMEKLFLHRQTPEWRQRLQSHFADLGRVGVALAQLAQPSSHLLLA